MRFKKNLDALNESLLVQIKWHIIIQFKLLYLGYFSQMEKRRVEHATSFQSPFVANDVPVFIFTQSCPLGALLAQLVNVGTLASGFASTWEDIGASQRKAFF